jgi:nascent polypeptide-associated complex subunit beta
MNPEKLARLQAAAQSAQLGGKGTVRRKVKKVQKGAAVDDKKIQAALKKLHAQTIPGIEEINMFKEDGNVLHVVQPNVQAAVTCNTFCFSGNFQEKEISELVPGILHQLGTDSIEALRRLAESLPKDAIPKKSSGDDDDIPDLVENFEENSSIKA